MCKMIAVMYWTKQSRKESLKNKIRLARDANSWRLRYRCSALSPELSSQLGAGHFVIWRKYIKFHIFELRMRHFDNCKIIICMLNFSSWKKKAWKNSGFLFVFSPLQQVPLTMDKPVETQPNYHSAFRVPKLIFFNPILSSQCCHCCYFEGDLILLLRACN